MTKKLEEEFEGIKLNKKRFQKLEKEILDDYHKTHEFTMPKQNNSPAVYDYGKIKEIFKVTPEINEELIAEKLRKTKEYKTAKKKKEKYLFSISKSNEGLFEHIRNWFKDREENINDLVSKAVGGLLITTFLGVLISYPVITFNIGREFNRVYATKQLEYGDINRDKIISDKERDEFGYKLLKNKGVIFNDSPEFGGALLNPSFYPSWPKDLIGNRIGIEQLTKWIEEYKE